MSPTAAAERLISAWRGGSRVPWRDIRPPGREAAYAIQDATVAALGPIAGWKVGAKGPQAEPTCAPIPSVCLLASGAMAGGPHRSLRGIEVELALRVGRELGVADASLPAADLAGAFDAVMPAIEIVETRLSDWSDSDALAQLADLQSHGALVIGNSSGRSPASIDLSRVEAELRFDGEQVASASGGNPAVDLWRMVGWLIGHCAERGQPLRKGQVVTTGSCTGLLFAAEGTTVAGSVAGFGAVTVTV